MRLIHRILSLVAIATIGLGLGYWLALNRPVVSAPHEDLVKRPIEMAQLPPATKPVALDVIEPPRSATGSGRRLALLVGVTKYECKEAIPNDLDGPGNDIGMIKD